MLVSSCILFIHGIFFRSCAELRLAAILSGGVLKALVPNHFQKEEILWTLVADLNTQCFIVIPYELCVRLRRVFGSEFEVLWGPQRTAYLVLSTIMLVGCIS